MLNCALGAVLRAQRILLTTHAQGKGKGDPYKASGPVLYQTATFELSVTAPRRIESEDAVCTDAALLLIAAP